MPKGNYSQAAEAAFKRAFHEQAAQGDRGTTITVIPF